MKYDFVVVGAGVSGLTAALLLARDGRRVALVERAPRLAPLLQGFARQGVHFETGFHYAGGLDEEGLLWRFLRVLGLERDLRTFPLAVAGFDRCRFAGGDEFAFPAGEANLTMALGRAFPAAKEGIEAFLAQLTEARQALPYLNLEVPFAALGPFGASQGPTLAEALRPLAGEQRLSRLLALHTLLHGVPAQEVPLALHASVAGLYYRSAHGLYGGGRALVAAFAARLEGLGVELHLGRAAQRFSLSPTGELSGVELTGGERLEAAGCIFSGHPDQLGELAGPGTFRPAYRRRLAQLTETVSAFLLYADAPAAALGHGNLFLLGEDDVLGGLERPAEERCLYLAANPPRGPGSEGRGVVAICPARLAEVAAWQDSRLGARPEGYRDFKAGIMERLARRIERQVPELAGRLRVLAGATPLTLRDYLGHPGGGLYGVAHRVGQYNPQAATRLKGLFLTGQATAAPGVLGGILAGFLTAGQILGHEPLRNEVRACH